MRRACASVRAIRAPFPWLAALLLLGCAACSEARPGSAASLRNAVLVTLDTTRADVLGCAGSLRALTPEICALREQGVCFERAYTTAPLTLPAHASIFTGLYPPRHGVRDNGIAVLPPAASTLAEALRGAGFATAAFVSSAVLDRAFGLDQGFALYDQPAGAPRGPGGGYLERRAGETVAAARAWLRSGARARPFFLWVHLFDAHVPYAPEPEFLERAGGDPYRGEVAALDAAVGELLRALRESGVEQETLVVLTADHGESLGEHGEPTHGALAYEAAVRVPLCFRFPRGLAPPGSAARVASLVDVAPTILGRLGIGAPIGLDGVDLFSPAAAEERGVYLETYAGYLNYGWSPVCGWVDAQAKYLHGPRPELYRPDEDPHERRDLSAAEPEACARARERIAEVLARPALAAVEVEPGAELAGELARLGYAQAAGPRAALPSPLEPMDRPGARERAGELAPLLEAHALFEAQRYAKAEPLLAAIVAENPGHLLALDLLALCRMHAGDFGRARELLLERLRHGPPRADALINLAICHEMEGDVGAALERYREAERLVPGNPEVEAGLARSLKALEGSRAGSGGAERPA